MQHIAIIGSTNIDFVVKVHHMPEAGETIMGGELEKIPGGKGANQAYACGMLGANASFISAYGNDGLGRLMLDNMAKANVNCEGVFHADDRATGIALIYVNEEGNNSIVVVPGANATIDKEHLQTCEKILDESDIWLVQMEIPLETVAHVIKEGHARKKTVILNPAPAPLNFDKTLLQGLSYVTPNETELALLSGMPTDTIDEVEAAANELIRLGAKNVIVTLGERGAMHVDAQKSALYPVPKTNAIDTTAAGDTFNAGVAVKLAEGCSIEESIHFANVAAAISVSRKGAQPSVPSLEEVLCRM